MKQHLDQPLSLATGSVITRHRRSSRHSQSAVAFAAGIDLGSMFNMENGRHSPNLARFVRVCRVLGLEPGRTLTEILEELTRCDPHCLSAKLRPLPPSLPSPHSSLSRLGRHPSRTASLPSSSSSAGPEA